MLSAQGNTAVLSFSRRDIAVTGGFGASQVIAADLNRDGKPDLVVSSYPSALTIFLGNGDGTFQSRVYQSFTDFAGHIAVADLNGDSKLDIVLVTEYTIYTMLANGDGTFQAPQLALQAGFCCSFVLGDWNGDKKPDVAGAPGNAYTALGKGDATFGPWAQLPGPTSTLMNGIATEDVNSDGKADLIVTYYATPAIGVYLGNGDGTFQPPIDIPATAAPFGVLAVGDLNGDSKPDVAFSVNLNDDIDVMLGNGDGTFRTSVVLTITPTFAPSATALAFADIDRDGKLDLVGVHESGAYIYLGNKDGTFLVPVEFPLNNNVNSMAIADLDLDGKPDIITANSDSGLTILMNTSVLTNVVGRPAISTDPTNVNARAGELASFSSSAAGTPTPTIQWQVSTDSGATFSNIPGANSPTYSFTVAESQNGNLYRAVFTNPAGSAISTAASLTTMFPSLTVRKTHSGDFTLGQQNATYQVVVSNTDGNAPTNAPVVVQERLPSGLTLVSMAGTGWNCPTVAFGVCMRSDPLPAGASYPPITVTVNVAANANSPQINVVSVSGGGSANAGAADSTIFIGDAASGLGFFPVAPCRAVDTRSSQRKSGDFGPPELPSSAPRNFPLQSSNCGLPADAQAYALNFTVVPAGPLAYLSAWPDGQLFTGVSTLNSTDGSTLANAAIVPTGANGAITVMSGNPTDLIIDTNGYFAPPNGSDLAFYPLTPCRIADTRADQGKTGAFGPPSLSSGGIRDFPIQSSACNVSNTAAAYSLNITTVPQGPLPYLSTWPTGEPYPNVSTLNSNDGSVIANAAIVPAGSPNGSIRVLSGGITDLIIDVNGYFGPPGAIGALHFYPVTPCRVADTRTSQRFTGAFGPPSLIPNGTRDFPMTSSACGIPSTAQAFSLNMTVVPQGPLGYLSVWPTGQPYPNVSTLNSPKGTTLANAAIVPAGTNGSITVLAGGATDLIIDINGYFAP